MSESNVEINTPASASTQPVTAETPATILRRSVEEVLATSGPTLRDRVKTHLVEEELKRRADLILKGLAKRDEARKALNKIRPDQSAYNGDGKVIPGSESYSKPKVEELKKAREALERIDKALEEALLDEKPNFEKLGKVVGGGGGEEKKEKEE